MGSPLFPILANIYMEFFWRTGFGESRQETIIMAQMCGWHICYLHTWLRTPATLSTSSQLPQTLYQIHCGDKEGWYTSFPGFACNLQSRKSHHTDHIVQNTNTYRLIYPLSILPPPFHQDWNHSNPAPLIKDHMPRSRLTGFSSYFSVSTDSYLLHFGLLDKNETQHPNHEQPLYHLDDTMHPFFNPLAIYSSFGAVCMQQHFALPMPCTMPSRASEWTSR